MTVEGLEIYTKHHTRRKLIDSRMQSDDVLPPKLEHRSQCHLLWLANQQTPLRDYNQYQAISMVESITRARGGIIIFRNPLNCRDYVQCSLHLKSSKKTQENVQLSIPHLSVLPSSSLSTVGSNSVEAQAVIVELDALETDKHLPRRAVGHRASNETTEFVRKVAEGLAVSRICQVPPSNHVPFRDGSTVGDGVLDSTSLGVDVDLLAAGNAGSHAENVVAAGKVGGVAGRAGAELLDVGRAVGGCGLVEPEGLVGGRDGGVVDGRGGADGEEAEVLGRGGEEEGVEGGDGGEGLHVCGVGLVFCLKCGCLSVGRVCWWIDELMSCLFVLMWSEGMEGFQEGLDTLIPLFPHALNHYSLLSPYGMWNVTFLVFRPRCNDATMIKFAILREFPLL